MGSWIISRIGLWANSLWLGSLKVPYDTNFTSPIFFLATCVSGLFVKSVEVRKVRSSVVHKYLFPKSCITFPNSPFGFLTWYTILHCRSSTFLVNRQELQQKVFYPDRCFPFCVISVTSAGASQWQQVQPCHPMPTMHRWGKYNTDFGISWNATGRALSCIPRITSKGWKVGGVIEQKGTYDTCTSLYKGGVKSHITYHISRIVD